MRAKPEYTFSNSDRNWMAAALKEAQKAVGAGEIPVACVLVGGDKEVSRGQTQTSRRGSMAAHGELCTLLDIGSAIYKSSSPLVLYTTLEPCLMCIGASVNCGIQRIIYAMPASADGGVKAYSVIEEQQLTPEIQIYGDLMCEEAVSLMGEFVQSSPQHFGHEYAKTIYEGALTFLKSRNPTAKK